MRIGCFILTVLMFTSTIPLSMSAVADMRNNHSTSENPASEQFGDGFTETIIATSSDNLNVPRDLEFHPECHLEPFSDQPEAVRDLITEKRRWIDTRPTATLARRRCHEIRSTNARLAYHTQPVRQQLLDRVGPLATAIRAQKILRTRDFPWCFFPENQLREFLLLEID